MGVAWLVDRCDACGQALVEDTYARWLKRTDDQLRAAFDDYDRAASA
jgi:hypothetical protein